jgi:hypothetical protein
MDIWSSSPDLFAFLSSAFRRSVLKGRPLASNDSMRAKRVDSISRTIIVRALVTSGDPPRKALESREAAHAPFQ